MCIRDRYAAFTRLLDDPAEYERLSQASNPYGDGFACARIARILGAGR